MEGLVGHVKEFGFFFFECSGKPLKRTNMKAGLDIVY